MTTENQSLGGILISEHPLRSNILGEIHARPFNEISSPRDILRTVFFSDPRVKINDDAEVLTLWCQRHNLEPPKTGSRHHIVTLDTVRLTWERHTEFVTLTWDTPHTATSAQDLQALSHEHSGTMIACPLVLISASVVTVTSQKRDFDNIHADHEADNLCKVDIAGKSARLSTHFRQNDIGATVFAVQNLDLNNVETGILVRRILEIETYRTMALLGFEEAKTLSPELSVLENRLIDLSSEFSTKKSLEETRQTLNDIIEISSKVTNISAANHYRLSATQAYYDLVSARLVSINEQAVPGYSSLTDFLDRRMAPAIKTCANISSRLSTITEKLKQASTLLQTNVSIQMQDQNNRLLETMNERANMQFRLQTTVEGLSIAAVSYYVVGLIAYLLKGFEFTDSPTQGKIVAVSVPIVILAIWLLIRRIKQSHKTN